MDEFVKWLRGFSSRLGPKEGCDIFILKCEDDNAESQVLCLTGLPRVGILAFWGNAVIEWTRRERVAGLRLLTTGVMLYQEADRGPPRARFGEAEAYTSGAALGPSMRRVRYDHRMEVMEGRWA